MSYLDGFVIPVPKGKKEAYRKLAEDAGQVFLDYGALRIVETWGDDVPDGKVTDFRRAVQATGEETVVFSWTVWPSKDVRDAAIKKVEADPRMQMTPDMPFDPKRMIMGGFRVLFDSAGELKDS